MITIYGIKNCDTMKKAMRWLDEHGVDYRFHDYRKDGLDSRQLKAWEEGNRLGNAAQPPRHVVAKTAGNVT